MRSIPIDPPGGNDAAVGSSDNPTYSVTVSDSEAAGFRSARKEDLQSKRLFPADESYSSMPVPERLGGICTGCSGWCHWSPRACQRYEAKPGHYEGRHFENVERVEEEPALHPSARRWSEMIHQKHALSI